MTENLVKDGVAAEVIHGNKAQNARQRALNAFRNGQVRVLVATDIVARGIDVPGVTHVINYDLPDEPEAYVHRIGRTGRNGADGIAITLCAPDEIKKLRAVEKVTRQVLLAGGRDLPVPGGREGPAPGRRPARSTARSTGRSMPQAGPRRRPSAPPAPATAARAAPRPPDATGGGACGRRPWRPPRRSDKARATQQPPDRNPPASTRVPQVFIQA